MRIFFRTKNGIDMVRKKSHFFRGNLVFNQFGLLLRRTRNVEKKEKEEEEKNTLLFIYNRLKFNSIN